MGIDYVSIVLDNPIKVYFPGQTITGKVVVCITGDVATTTGIRLELKGKTNVWFTKQYGRTTVTFMSSETYFNQQIPIDCRDGASFTLAVGQYEYPFAFILPHQIPSSYESSNGKVRYHVKAIIERSWKKNYACQLPFSVNAVVDLNTVQDAESTTEGTNKKTLGIPPFNSKPLKGKIWLDRIGYVPGESILVSAQFDNPTGKTMRDAKIQLIEVAVYRARGETHTSSRVINEIPYGEIKEKSYEWDRVPLLVPPVASSGLPFCSIIDVGYRVQLVIDPRALSINLKVPVNVIIGNIPLRCQFSSLHGAASPTSPPMMFSLKEGDNTVDYADLPPPNYGQSMLEVKPRDEKDEADEEQAEALPFKPVYATYSSLQQ